MNGFFSIRLGNLFTRKPLGRLKQIFFLNGFQDGDYSKRCIFCIPLDMCKHSLKEKQI